MIMGGSGGGGGDDNKKSKNPLSGLGGLGNIMDAMKKAQEFTSVAKDLQDELKNTEIEASVRDGQVTVTMTGQQVPVKVEVTDDLVAQGSEQVSAAVTEAVIAAHTKSSQYMKEKMGNLTKGMFVCFSLCHTV